MNADEYKAAIDTLERLARKNGRIDALLDCWKLAVLFVEETGSEEARSIASTISGMILLEGGKT